jgi:TRAP-type C4-dicarboxylate transport system permease large subunit
MIAQFFKVRWLSVFLAGIVAGVLATLGVFLVTAAYAAALAIEGQMQLSGDLISQLATRLAPLLRPVLAVIVTIIGAAWAARRAQPGVATLHGVLVGFIVAASVFLTGSVGVEGIVGFVLTIGAGWLGGWLVERRRQR